MTFFILKKSIEFHCTVVQKKWQQQFKVTGVQVTGWMNLNRDGKVSAKQCKKKKKNDTCQIEHQIAMSVILEEKKW